MDHFGSCASDWRVDQGTSACPSQPLGPPRVPFGIPSAWCFLFSMYVYGYEGMKSRKNSWKFINMKWRMKQVMLLTRISFNQIQICWLYHPRFAEWFLPWFTTQACFRKPPNKPISPKTSFRGNCLPYPEISTKLGRLGECSPLRSRPRILRFCLLSPALPQHRCDQGVQRWNVKVWRPMHPPKN